ncbi:MAG: type II secretion system F family protein [Dehalococcoidia bacterium]|nr:type II secretion system F family protein [Dehalococcoidia bacterium]
MAITLAVLAFVFVSCTVVATAMLISAGGTAVIDRRLDELRHGLPEPAGDRPKFASVFGLFKRVGNTLPRSPKEMSKLRLRLTHAGFRRDDALPLFYGARVATALGLFLVVATPVFLRPNMMLAFGGLLLGYVAPGFVLARLATRRQHRIRLALADALDLLVVSVEAGLGLDQALQRVGDELAFAYPELSNDLRLVTLELRAGTDRADALRNLADRSGVDDLSALVAMLIQTDRFGTSVSQSLRVHAETLRIKRRQRAEEAAAKTGVKMVFPLVFCIFPAIWVVTIGPAAIRFVNVLLPIVEQTR